MTKRNKTRGFLTIFIALLAIAGLIGLLPNSSATPGLMPDMRGSWLGTFVVVGTPSTTPQPITMDVSSQGIGNFSGAFSVYGNPPGTLNGTITNNGSVTFRGSSANFSLTNGTGTFTDYGGGAAILDGTMTVTATNPVYSGFRKFREIRPYANPGDCPCTPRVGDYVGTWGDHGSGGPIKFTVQAADQAMPTKFTSYLYITIGGQMTGFGLYGTSNGDGDVVAIAHSTVGRLTMTADLVQPLFMRPSSLTGSFRYELHDGTVIEERFSATKQ